MTLPPFQVVLDTHRDELYRFVVASVGSADADDCFQETWIAALRGYPRLRHDGNLRAWLFRIAHRKAIDFHRARVRRALPIDAPPERAVDPGTLAENGEPALWGHVRALPPKQRTAVFFRSVLGMPYAELAQALDCSEEAARRNVHEGLKRLREEVGSWT